MNAEERRKVLMAKLSKYHDFLPPLAFLSAFFASSGFLYAAALFSALQLRLKQH